MNFPTCESNRPWMRPYQALTQAKFFDCFDSSFISAKQVMVELLQPGLSIIAYVKTRRETPGNILSLKNHTRVPCLCKQIRGHYSQVAASYNCTLHTPHRHNHTYY